MEIILGVSCIKGEIHSLITLMRLNTRWSSKSYKHHRDSYLQEDPLIENFQRLNSYLEGVIDLQDVDCVTYVLPFYHLIVSEQAGCAVTSAALSSLSKFALYGFFSPQFPRVQEAMALIARCISHCVFEETDWESDELILMKLLELATLCFRCQASSLLSAESAWDVFSTCKSIHEHYRASKILKNEAESALVHLTLNTFSRASHMILKLGLSKDTLFSAVDPKACFLSDTKGVALILLNIVRVISSMMEQQQPETLKLALTLINVALEAGGLALNHIDPLVDAFCNDICRHLLRATQSDDLEIFSCALRVVFNLFMSMKDNMKVQLEVFLSSVHLRVLHHSSTFAREELTLESLLEFCREPSLMQDLYINYDCDVRCTNLFDSIIQALCRRATLEISPPFATSESSLSPSTSQHASLDAATLADRYMQVSSGSPVGGYDGVSSGVSLKRLTIIHRLAFEGLSTILHGMVVRQEEDALHFQSSAFSQSIRPISSSIGTGRRGLTTAEHVMAVTKTGLDGEDMLETEIDKWCEDMSESDLLSQDAYDDNVGPPKLSVPVTPTGKGQPSSITIAGVPRAIASLPPSLVSSPSSSALTRAVLRSQASTPTQVPLISNTHPSMDRSDAWEQSSDHGNGGGGSLSSVGSVSIVDREHEITQTILEQMKKAEIIRKRKFMKQRLRSIAETFNAKPLKNEWLQMACDIGLIARLPAKTLTEAFEEVANAAAKADVVEQPPSEIIAGSEDLTQTTQDAADSSTAPVENDNAPTPEKIAPPPPPPPPRSVAPTPTKAAGPTMDEANPVGADPQAVAEFLKTSPGLGKAQIGEFISKGPADLFPFHAAVLHAFTRTFDFLQPDGTVMTFDQALRHFLSTFRLPGEAQCIDRIMEAFAGRYFVQVSQQPTPQPFASADAVFILSFSTILLNTDLHNPQIPAYKKMTKDQFLRNNRGINDGKDLPRVYLEQLYDNIKRTQIQVQWEATDAAPPQASATSSGTNASVASVSGSSGGAPQGGSDFTDPLAWQKLLTHVARDQAPAEFTPLASVRLWQQLQKKRRQLQIQSTAAGNDDDSHGYAGHGYNGQSYLRWTAPPVSYHGDMFVTMSRPFIHSHLVLWYHHQYPLPSPSLSAVAYSSFVPDDWFLRRLLQTLADYGRVCVAYDLIACFNAMLQAYVDGCVTVAQQQRRWQQPRVAATLPPPPSTAASSSLPLSATPAAATPTLASTALRAMSKVNMLLTRSLYDQWRREQPQWSQDWTQLLTLPSLWATPSSLPSPLSQPLPVMTSPASMAASPASSDRQLWTDASLFKTEITLQLLLDMIVSQPELVSRDTWAKVWRLLLWCRGRGALPDVLAHIDHAFYILPVGCANEVTKNDAIVSPDSVVSIRYAATRYAKARFLVADRVETRVVRAMFERATQRAHEYYRLDRREGNDGTNGSVRSSDEGDDGRNTPSSSWFSSFLWSSSGPDSAAANGASAVTRGRTNSAVSLGSNTSSTTAFPADASTAFDKKLPFLSTEDEARLFGDCNDSRHLYGTATSTPRTDDWLLELAVTYSALMRSRHRQSRRLFVFATDTDLDADTAIHLPRSGQHVAVAMARQHACHQRFVGRVDGLLATLQGTLQRLTHNAIDAFTTTLSPSSDQNDTAATSSGSSTSVTQTALSLDELFPTSQPWIRDATAPPVTPPSEWDAVLVLDWLARFLLPTTRDSWQSSPSLANDAAQTESMPTQRSSVSDDDVNGGDDGVWIRWRVFGDQVLHVLHRLLRHEADVLLQNHLHFFLERCITVALQAVQCVIVLAATAVKDDAVDSDGEEFSDTLSAVVMRQWQAAWPLLRWIQDLPLHVRDTTRDLVAAGTFALVRQLHLACTSVDLETTSSATMKGVVTLLHSSEPWTRLLSVVAMCLTPSHGNGVLERENSVSTPSRHSTGYHMARDVLTLCTNDALCAANYAVVHHVSFQLVSRRVAEVVQTVDWSSGEVTAWCGDLRRLVHVTLAGVASLSAAMHHSSTRTFRGLISNNNEDTYEGDGVFHVPQIVGLVPGDTTTSHTAKDTAASTMVQQWQAVTLLIADWTAGSSATIANAALQALNVLLGVAVTSAATSRVAMLISPAWLPTSAVARVVETLLGRIPLQLPPPTMATLAWQQPRHGALWRATRATQMLVQLCLMYIPQWRDSDTSSTSSDSDREDRDAHEARVTAIVVQLVTALAANVALVPHQYPAPVSSAGGTTPDNKMPIVCSSPTTLPVPAVTTDDLLRLLATLCRMVSLPTAAATRGILPNDHDDEDSDGDEQHQPKNRQLTNAISSPSPSVAVSVSGAAPLPAATAAGPSPTAPNASGGGGLFSYLNPLSYIFAAPVDAPASVPVAAPVPTVASQAQPPITPTKTAASTVVAESPMTTSEDPSLPVSPPPPSPIRVADVVLVSRAYEAALAVNPAVEGLLRHFDPTLWRALRRCCRLRAHWLQNPPDAPHVDVVSNASYAVPSLPSPQAPKTPSQDREHASHHHFHMADLTATTAASMVAALPSPAMQSIRPVAIDHPPAPSSAPLSAPLSATSAVRTPVAAVPTTVTAPVSSAATTRIQQPPVGSNPVYALRPHTARYPVLTGNNHQPPQQNSNSHSHSHGNVPVSPVTKAARNPTRKDLLASPVQII